MSTSPQPAKSAQSAIARFGGGGVAGVGLALAWSGAPWWATLLVVLVFCPVLLVQAIFPQNSRDRLAWWRDRRKHIRETR